MTRQSIGRVTPLSKGAFNSNNTYERLDIVTYNGSSYMAKQQTVGNLPTNTEYWQLIAEKGDPGTTNYEELEHKPDLTVYALKSESGYKLDLEMNSSTFVITPKLYNKNNVLISTGTSIDLPMESVVVSGSYDNTNKKIVLTLKNGSTIDVPVGDLIGGLQSEINASNQISSDFVDDTDKIHKFMSAEEKTKLAGIANNANNYVLPDATKNSKGGVQVGEGLNVSDGILSYDDSDDLEEFIINFLAITSDNRHYGVEWPLWETSTSKMCTRLFDAVNFDITPGTDTVRCISNLPSQFDSYNVNAFRDNEGKLHITSIEGMIGKYVDTIDETPTVSYKNVNYKVDVFRLIRTRYFKLGINSNGNMQYDHYWHPKEGYHPTPQSIQKDGTVKPYFLISKYVGGIDNDNDLRSVKGLKPAHYLGGTTIGTEDQRSTSISYSGCIDLCHRRGTYYSAGRMEDYMYILLDFYLKFGTRDTQSIMRGNTSNSYQYEVAQTEENVNRVILTTAQAANIDLLSCVSVGDVGTNTNLDRNYKYIHNICNDVRVIGKEVIDENHTALILDHEPFTTTETTYVTSMHEVSGYSDYVLGDYGSPISNTNGKHGMVFDGIEIAVGGYEVASNAIMDIVDSTGKREIYVINDSSKLSGNVNTIKTTYNKSNLSIQPTTLNAWNSITEMEGDLVNNIFVPTKAGASGSGTSVGYCDSLYVDAGTSGQREFLLLGSLNSSNLAGLSCLNAYYGLTSAFWSFLARLSINGVGGELAS